MDISLKHLDWISVKFAETFQYNGWLWGSIDNQTNNIELHSPSAKEIEGKILGLISDFTDDTTWIQSGRIRVERCDGNLMVMLVAEQDVLPITVQKRKILKETMKKKTGKTR